jgi:hypothetical protein
MQKPNAHSIIALLRFFGIVVVPQPLLHRVGPANDHTNFHSSEQGTLPTTPLISKQVIPYRTRGGTYCHGVSTPKILSLADLSMTNHITRRNTTVCTIPILLKPRHRTSPRSTHISMDGRPQLSHKDTSHTQHHKDGRLVRHS